MMASRTVAETRSLSGESGAAATACATLRAAPFCYFRSDSGHERPMTGKPRSKPACSSAPLRSKWDDCSPETGYIAGYKPGIGTGKGHMRVPTGGHFLLGC